MPDDYMMDDEESNAAPESEGKEGYDSEICLIDKAIAPNASPGDKITVEVSKVYEKELAVKRAGKPKEKEEPPEVEEETIDLMEA
jgi:hypothetical protein